MKQTRTDAEAARTLALASEIRVLIGQLRRRLREEARPGDLTQSQISVLIQLERAGPATVTTLARAEGVRPQSMGATIATLQEAGLIRGSADPTDGRQTILALTDACRELIRANRAAKEDWLARVISVRLNAHEQERLATTIDLLKRLAQP